MWTIDYKINFAPREIGPTPPDCKTLTSLLCCFSNVNQNMCLGSECEAETESIHTLVQSNHANLCVAFELLNWTCRYPLLHSGHLDNPYLFSNQSYLDWLRTMHRSCSQSKWFGQKETRESETLWNGNVVTSKILLTLWLMQGWEAHLNEYGSKCFDI